jgi:glycerol-3-phosphate cytidylyltransferase
MEFNSIHEICRDLRQTLNENGEPPVIGFTCSSFDLLHSGHYLMLEDCKDHCDVLIIGLQDDPTLDSDYRLRTGGKNKNSPIQSYEERLIQITGVKYIDHVVRYATESELYELLQLIKPNIRMIGEDWRGKEFTGHDLDIPIHFNPRSHSYSTSALRNRVYEAEKLKRDTK